MLMPKCDLCGQFHSFGPGSAWQMVFSGVLPEPDHVETRCKKCVAKHGGFEPDPRIKPEHSCGINLDLPA